MSLDAATVADPFTQPDGSWPPEVDNAAPTPPLQQDHAEDWGVNPKTGKPYTMSPEKRAEMGERLAAGRRAAGGVKARVRNAAPKRTARQATGKTPAPKGVDYRPTLAGLIQLVCMPLAVAGRWIPALTYDSLAIARATPAIVEVGQDILVENPSWAAAVERAGQLSPAGMAAMVLLPLGMQIAANHGLIKPQPEMGILSREELLAEAQAQAPDA